MMRVWVVCRRRGPKKDYIAKSAYDGCLAIFEDRKDAKKVAKMFGDKVVPMTLQKTKRSR